MKKDGFIPEVYYLDIVCFLTFNVAGMMGNFVTLKVKCPGPGTIWIPVVLRTLFIPFLMFCNYKVRIISGGWRRFRYASASFDVD